MNNRQLQLRQRLTAASTEIRDWPRAGVNSRNGGAAAFFRSATGEIIASHVGNQRARRAGYVLRRNPRRTPAAFDADSSAEDESRAAAVLVEAARLLGTRSVETGPSGTSSARRASSSSGA